MTIALAFLRRYWLHALIAAAAVWALHSAYGFAYDNGYNAANARAEKIIAQMAKAEAEARAAAIRRDDTSAAKTDTARQSGETRAAEITERAERIREVVHERLVPVPAVCPSPDADLLRELAEGAARVSATEGRLRGLRRAAGQAAE